VCSWFAIGAAAVTYRPSGDTVSRSKTRCAVILLRPLPSAFHAAEKIRTALDRAKNKIAIWQSHRPSGDG
jgi:hypothetical protein